MQRCALYKICRAAADVCGKSISIKSTCMFSQRATRLCRCYIWFYCSFWCRFYFLARGVWTTDETNTRITHIKNIPSKVLAASSSVESRQKQLSIVKVDFWEDTAHLCTSVKERERAGEGDWCEDGRRENDRRANRSVCACTFVCLFLHLLCVLPEPFHFSDHAVTTTCLLTLPE